MFLIACSSNHPALYGACRNSYLEGVCVKFPALFNVPSYGSLLYEARQGRNY